MKENIPIPSGNDVYWERWVDAYDYEDEGLDLTFNNLEEQADNQDYLTEQEQEELLREMQSLNTIKTIFTPFGIMPLTEHSLASKHFKLWVGHVNFKLTNKFYDVIGDVTGVESVDILTPYRFRMAVGKMFRDRDVMAKVKKAMLKELRSE